MKEKKRVAFISIIVAYYLITRLWGISSAMNEYFDYDEGTYLMIARFINHGLLPYRDVFAVHPPLYYYLLALWMRIFGDSYVIGRLLSVFLGLMAVIVAYFAGKELRGWKTGVILSAIVTMDPIMVHMNGLVFHETTIELFTLLSLYHFIKYAKFREEKHALLSLFWAGLGSTSKFTIIPYAAALYVLLLLYLDAETEGYAQKGTEVILTRLQVFILLATYAAMIILVTDAVMLHPSNELRRILIVPGLHKIELVGHIIPAGIFLTLWGAMTLYVFRISYLSKIIRTVKSLAKNTKPALLYLAAFLLPKIIIEGIFGFAVSRSYMDQTYLAQGSRYSPLAGAFDFMFNLINYFKSEKPDFAMFYIPILLVVLFVGLRWARKESFEKPSITGPLFVLSAVMYLIVFPVIPNMRFLYPMVLTLYLAFLESIPEVEVGSTRKLAAALAVFIIVLGIADYGVTCQYREGKLLLAWASHSKDLRDDLGDYIKTEGLNGTYLSVNPFNAYYLNLRIYPYYLDTFGLVYLKNSTELWKVVNGSDYLLFSTWMYAMMKESSVFKEAFGKIKEYAVMNTTLLYAESYKRGDVVELFDNRKRERHFVGISSFFGKLQLWVNGSNVGHVYTARNGMNFTERTIIEWVRNGYAVRQFSESNESTSLLISPAENGILLKFDTPENVTVEFTSPVVVLSGNKKANPGESGLLKIFTPKTAFEVITDGKVIKNAPDRLVVGGCTFITIKTP